MGQTTTAERFSIWSDTMATDILDRLDRMGGSVRLPVGSFHGQIN